MRFIVVFFSLLLSSISANAWDGVTTGKIVRMESVGGASNGENFDLRVTLSQGTPPCPGNPAAPVDWSYINTNNYNYAGVFATLMLAYSKGKNVTIYSNTVGGFCHIGWVIISG